MNGRGSTWARRAGLLAAAGVLLAGNLAFFLWYRGTSRDRRHALESQLSALEQDVAAKEAEAKKLAQDRGRLSGVRAALDEFYGHRIGAERETLAGVVDEVHSILKKSGVSAGQIGYATSTIDSPPLNQMLITFSFKGDYARFKQLLEAFQSSRKWLAVRTVSLTRDQETPGAVQVAVSVVTYFSADESGPARAGLAEGRVR